MTDSIVIRGITFGHFVQLIQIKISGVSLLFANWYWSWRRRKWLLLGYRRFILTFSAHTHLKKHHPVIIASLLFIHIRPYLSSRSSFAASNLLLCKKFHFIFTIFYLFGEKYLTNFIPYWPVLGFFWHYLVAIQLAKWKTFQWIIQFRVLRIARFCPISQTRAGLWILRRSTLSQNYQLRFDLPAPPFAIQMLIDVLAVSDYPVHRVSSARQHWPFKLHFNMHISCRESVSITLFYLAQAVQGPIWYALRTIFYRD